MLVIGNDVFNLTSLKEQKFGFVCCGNQCIEQPSSWNLKQRNNWAISRIRCLEIGQSLNYHGL